VAVAVVAAAVGGATAATAAPTAPVTVAAEFTGRARGSGCVAGCGLATGSCHRRRIQIRHPRCRHFNRYHRLRLRLRRCRRRWLKWLRSSTSVALPAQSPLGAPLGPPPPPPLPPPPSRVPCCPAEEAAAQWRPRRAGRQQRQQQRQRPQRWRRLRRRRGQRRPQRRPCLCLGRARRWTQAGSSASPSAGDRQGAPLGRVTATMAAQARAWGFLAAPC